MENILKKTYIVIKKNLFLLVIILPNVLFFYYQVFMASPRFESRTKIFVEQPDNTTTLDASMALLSGFGVSKQDQDTQLVKAYVLSYDMLQHLEEELSIQAHYSMSNADPLSRLALNSSSESFYQYYLDRVRVEIDEKSSVMSIFVQAFTPEMALKISQSITEKAEWFINDIGHRLAEAQLSFVNKEHNIAKEKLQENKLKLIEFQRQYNLLDPKQESIAISQIGYGIESKIAQKSAELKALKSVMDGRAPRVMTLVNEISALKEQLELEKLKLVGESSERSSLSLNEVLNKYSALKVELEMTLSAFTSSTISLEKARIEAYRKIKYLVVIENSKLPEENKYPKVVYNISLMLVITIIVFGFIRIITATIKELR